MSITTPKQNGNGKWGYDLRHPVTKKRKRVKIFRTKSEAEQAQAVLQAKWRRAAHGIEVNLSDIRLDLRILLHEEADKLRSEAKLPDGSVIQWKIETARRADIYADMLPKNLRVIDLHTEHLIEIRDRELRKGIKPKSVETYLFTFLSVLKRIQSRYQHILEHWTIPTFSMPKGLGEEKVKSRRVWTQEEFESVLAILESDSPKYGRPDGIPSRKDSADILRLAASTGMRKTEILMLTWTQIDFQNQIIRATTLKKRNRDKGKVREIPMSEMSFDVLRKRYANREDKLDLLVFPRWRRDRRAQFLYLNLMAACRFAGIPYGDKNGGVIPHGLRHTAATQMLAGGTDIKTAAEILGHDIETMLRTYAHTTMESKRKAVSGLGQFGALKTTTKLKAVSK